MNQLLLFGLAATLGAIGGAAVAFAVMAEVMRRTNADWQELVDDYQQLLEEYREASQ